MAYKTLNEARAPDTGGSEQIHLVPPCFWDARRGRFVWTSKCAQVLTVSGAIAGFLSGLLGVGGGFVIVPALQRHTDLATRFRGRHFSGRHRPCFTHRGGQQHCAGQLDLAVALPFAAGGAAEWAQGQFCLHG